MWVLPEKADITKMEHDEMGFQTAPEGPILCVNNCGFFGSSGNMNMCSKCYKDLISKQEHAQLAASSLENIVKGSSSGNDDESSLVDSASVEIDLVEGEAKPAPLFNTLNSAASVNSKSKEGPNRCSTCKKRIGLTGFSCRCGNIFCGTHRYSDKHECPFDYRSAGQDAIAKANPVIKAEKLDKI
ncbi:zinc finger A20 and AN1 domain-containing stress-associated protein 8-like isoform X1 [Henckelia pumila]|uniref:zinc finger A20 and AN1 domain-containing stress-associated protein 8-like isoform X1 n=1 Tax=Henckelia pumila TaxID=405737 RepID=UPI003C6E1023